MSERENFEKALYQFRRHAHSVGRKQAYAGYPSLPGFMNDAEMEAEAGAEVLALYDAALASRDQMADLCADFGEERDTALRERDEERSDARMFAWWVSHEAKAIDIDSYLEGVREGWTLAQWRVFVQAQMDRSLSRSGEGAK